MAEPKVRFKKDDGSSYPAWSDVVLGDIATRVTRKNTNGETDRPLTIASIEGLVDQRTYFGKTIASKDMSGYFLLKNGEYAYNKSYSAGYDYGSIKRLDKYDMGALSTLYICFALNDDQNSDFYDCYFNGLSWYNQMPQICAEGARNHGLLNVSPDNFFKIQLSVPSSKEEQQKIADFLSSVDEVISASEQEVANLEMQKKVVMKKIFSQNVRFKRADGSDFPEWIEYLLNDLSEMITVGIANSATHAYRTDGIVMLRNQNIKENNLDDADLIYIDKDFEKKYKNKRLKKNDILVARTGYPGIACLVPEKYENAQTFTTLIVRLLSGDIVPTYVCQYINSPNGKAYVASTQIGGGQKNSGAGIISKMPILLPCLEEQRLIADFLSDFDEAIVAAKKELELWKELKKGLLQQMFV